MFKKVFLVIFLILLISPFGIVYFGNVSPPLPSENPLSEDQIQEMSHFYHKDNWGVHQVFLRGNSFQRGQQFGYWTREYLFQQERALIEKLDEVMPSKLAQYSLFLFSMAWFQGLDRYYEKPWLLEMYGVSLHGSKEDRFFATPYTRQLAYHGIHDMGQMMIDKGLVMGACTQVARPLEKGWLLGRNFDFEGGAVFDEDKVLKWVFPETGVPYVSVIFSGMVGVISGVNQEGVYIGINAAGSDDFTRLGTPTTLIAAKALQFSKTAEEAIEILKNSQPLITDIFVVTDKGDTLYVVEKTPKRTKVIMHQQPMVVTNHLQHKDFQLDSTNTARKNGNTTLPRFLRAKELLTETSDSQDILNILRDKKKFKDRTVFGHRSSIDALIASHSLIYNSEKQILYVSRGPSLSQEFIGVDLTKSFAEQKPNLVEGLPKDPDFVDTDFKKVKESLKNLKTLRTLSRKSFCKKASDQFKKIFYPELLDSHYEYYWTKAEIADCFDHKAEAKDDYQKALEREPAYRWEREEIEERLQNL